MANVIRRVCIPRRRFLQGAGASLALPWLDAMVPASSPSPRTPLRTVFVYAPNGQKMDDWTPPDSPGPLELPFILEPLAKVRDRVIVFTGLALDGARPHGDGPGDHARSAAAFLTGAHPKKTGGKDIEAGVSVDQVMAARARGQTRYASLELGMESGQLAGICDSGYSCAYSNNLAWKTKSQPLPKQTRPAEVFARLFGELHEDPEEAARRRRRQLSILDAVLADTQSLLPRLGAADRSKLDAYLTAVRELELRIHGDEAEEPRIEPPDSLASRSRGSYSERLDLMYELIALAFRADLVRTVTFMLGNAGSNRSYRFLEVPEGHHDLSHHKGDRHNLSQIRKINRFHMERFAAFLERLHRLPEMTGTLLDHAAVVYGSGIGDGNRHNHDDLPVLLAGGLGNATPGNRHLVQPRNTPLCNLYLTLLHRSGIPMGAFGDSSGLLTL